MSCLFCHGISDEQLLFETQNFKLVFDIDPIQVGHLLIIAKSHMMDLRELQSNQFIELMNLEKALIERLEKDFSITGVTVIQNNGTILDEGTHFHVHIIPRYEDDAFWDDQRVKEHKLDLEKLASKLNCLKVAPN